MGLAMERPEASGELDGEFDAESAGEFDLPGPTPTMDEDPDRFTVMSAAKPGPLPAEVERELRQLAEAIGSVMPEPEGMIGTRFGRRVVVAPVDDPSNAVDIADVDMARHLVLTFGGEDPTPEGSLLAQVLFQRRELSHGYVQAPEVKAPTFSLMQRVLPSLRGAGAVQIDGVGTLAVGHRPASLAGAVQGIQEDEDEGAEEDGAGGTDEGPSPPTPAR